MLGRFFKMFFFLYHDLGAWNILIICSPTKSFLKNEQYYVVMYTVYELLFRYFLDGPMWIQIHGGKKVDHKIGKTQFQQIFHTRYGNSRQKERMTTNVQFFKFPYFYFCFLPPGSGSRRTEEVSHHADPDDVQ